LEEEIRVTSEGKCPYCGSVHFWEVSAASVGTSGEYDEMKPFFWQATCECNSCGKRFRLNKPDVASGRIL
jgi:transcription elongation factor Elf1